MAGNSGTPQHGDAVLRFVRKHGRQPSKRPRSPERIQITREISEENRAIYAATELKRLGFKELRVLDRIARDEAELAEVRAQIAELEKAVRDSRIILPEVQWPPQEAAATG